MLDALRHGFQPARVLCDDYTSSRPAVEIFSAFAKGHCLLGYVLLASLATAGYTILLGALQVSTSFYGATTFPADLASAIAAAFLNLFILLVSVAVGWRYSRRRFLTRTPGTMAAIMPYVLSSEKLKEDVRSVSHIKGQQEKIKELERRGRRYGFGYFENESEPGIKHFGVERNYMDGPDGKEHVRGDDEV